MRVVPAPTPLEKQADPRVDVTAGLVRLPTRKQSEKVRSRWRLPKSLERLAGVVVLFAAWQIAASAGWLTPKVLAGPNTVVSVGWDYLKDGTLEKALWASLQRVLWGLGIGVVAGVVLALISGLTRAGDDLIDSNVQMLRFVPIIGLQPLLILWLGLGETAKISLIVMGVAFPIYVQTVSAIRAALTGNEAQAQAARDRAAQALATAQNIPVDQARTQVQDYETQYRQAVASAKEAAVKAADVTAKAVTRGALFGALALLLGAVAAWFGGSLGVRMARA